MQSRQPPAYFRRVARAQRLRDLALRAGLLVYFCMYCVLVGGGAVGFYKLMQPTPYPNPEVPAYSPTDLPALRLDSERPTERSSEVEHAPGAEDTRKAKKSQSAILSSDTRRRRSAQSKTHDPKMDYAAQPAFGDYRPWGSYQAWSGYRTYSKNQESGGYRPWNSYQNWRGYRNGR